MYYLLVKHLRFFFEKHSLEPHWQQEMPVGHFHRGAFSIHYVYYAAAAKYTCQCLKKPKEEVKTEQKMSGHAIFDHICKSLLFHRKKRTTDRKDFFVSKSEMFYFRDRSIKNPIILVEFDDQYQCCCSEASVVISIVRS